MTLIEAIARAIMRHHDIDPDVFVGTPPQRRLS